MARKKRYSSDRYRSASRHAPHALAVESRELSLGREVRIKGPDGLGQPARERHVRFFNPSLVRAPRGLCPRCVFIASLRADVLHQCDFTTALKGEQGMPAVVQTNGFFKGTALAVFDGSLNVLGWTWLLNDPEKQVAEWGLRRQRRRKFADLNTSDYWIPRGASGAFPPPWGSQAYDARLFEYGDDGKIFATFVRVCHSRQPCHFAVSQVHVTGRPTADGGIDELRAWAYPSVPSTSKWAQGRNQALFQSVVVSAVAAEGAPPAATLMAMPWLGLVGSFGVPTFKRTQMSCAPWAVEGVKPRRVSPAIRRQNRAITARCTALLGVGHLHHSEGVRNLRQIPKGATSGETSGGAAKPFEFGADYDHFFFTVNPYPPHEPLAMSRDFCLSSVDYGLDCERVQFISGMALVPSTASVLRNATMWERPRGVAADETRGGGPEEDASLLLTYGVNDCEARVARIHLARVWGMLKPLPGATAACVAERGP